MTTWIRSPSLYRLDDGTTHRDAGAIKCCCGNVIQLSPYEHITDCDECSAPWSRGGQLMTGEG